MMSEVKHGLGADTEVGILEQLLHLGQNGGVLGGIENGKGLLADVLIGVAEQAADHRVGGALALHLKQAQGIQNLAGLGCRNFRGQQIGSGAIEHQGGRLLDVNPMPADVLLEGDHILPPGHGNRHQPTGNQQEGQPTDLARR